MSSTPCFPKRLKTSSPSSTQRPRAYVLETDIGWDPDDIFALLLLFKHCRTSGSPLAVLSSAEPPLDDDDDDDDDDDTAAAMVAAAKQTRAKAARHVLRGLGAADDEVLVAAGFPCKSTDPARPHYSEPVAEGVQEMVKVYEEKEGPLAVGCIDDVKEFLRQHSAGRDVVWIGIGAMSGLAAVVEDTSCPNPKWALQQGIAFQQVSCGTE
jgi:hypothetical protein